jgi:hypothetical protein
MNSVLSMPAVPRSYKEENWGNLVNSVRESVKRGPELEKRRISTVRRRYQETTGEDTPGWTRRSGCYGDF